MPNTTNNTQNSTNALGEITALKSLLADSDYSILKTLEGLLACTSATGIIAFLKDVTADIKDIATKRAEWRVSTSSKSSFLTSPRAAANTPVSRTNGGDEPCGN